MDKNHFVIASGHDFRVVPGEAQTENVALVLLDHGRGRDPCVARHDVLHVPQKNSTVIATLRGKLYSFCLLTLKDYVRILTRNQELSIARELDRIDATEMGDQITFVEAGRHAEALAAQPATEAQNLVAGLTT